MEQLLPAELVRHVAGSTGLPDGTAARVIADVIAFFGETIEEFVRRRHRELKGRGMKNAQIWAVLTTELAFRPFAAGPLTERQLRRIVYG
ncbi:hypothetical protein ACFS2C_27645 [Prauserella oleivorans]|uniref:Uncharacterized protein n=1 Tax=Prauserella oleivorans TaxID=1478153 RepID=A0ABW5WGZ0_9PSEU